MEAPPPLRMFTRTGEVPFDGLTSTDIVVARRGPAPGADGPPDAGVQAAIVALGRENIALHNAVQAWEGWAIQGGGNAVNGQAAQPAQNLLLQAHAEAQAAQALLHAPKIQTHPLIQALLQAQAQAQAPDAEAEKTAPAVRPQSLLDDLVFQQTFNFHGSQSTTHNTVSASPDAADEETPTPANTRLAPDALTAIRDDYVLLFPEDHIHINFLHHGERPCDFDGRWTRPFKYQQMLVPRTMRVEELLRRIGRPDALTRGLQQMTELARSSQGTRFGQGPMFTRAGSRAQWTLEQLGWHKHGAEGQHPVWVVLGRLETYLLDGRAD